MLDVGQGDSAFVELPDGRTLLVDGGGALTEGRPRTVDAGGAPAPVAATTPAFDPGAQAIVPWLERRGVRRVDFVVLTHPHPDHAGGLAAVVDHFPVGEIWTNGAASALPALERLRAAARARGAPELRPHALAGDGFSVEVLAPLVGGEVRVPAWFGENDGSIVLRLRYGARSVLLTGDIERFGESRLVGGVEHPGPLGPLAADVVKAPHHGSSTSSTPGFVEATSARAVVFSAGAGNRWGFPAAAVVERWEAAGARTFRTDEDGAITVRVDRDGTIALTTARRSRALTLGPRASPTGSPSQGAGGTVTPAPGDAVTATAPGVAP